MQADRCRVVVCRGCCCGTLSKHPDVDHAGQLERLRHLAVQRAALTVTGCLGNCDRSNNIVVVPSPHGRAQGGRVTWLTRMLTPELIDAVATWLEAGGPGVAPIPETLREHHSAAPRRRATTTAAAASNTS